VPRRIQILTLLVVFSLLIAVSTGPVLAGCPEGQQKEADFAFSQAGDFIKAQSWTQAIPQLQSALSICPEHANSLKYLGKAYFATEDFAQARTTFERLIEVRGKEAQSGDYMDLGKTYAKLKEYRLARQAYVNASRLAPEDCSILFNLAVMHNAVKDFPRSVEAFELVLDGCPNLREKVLPELTKACRAAAERERGFGNVKEADLYAVKASEYGSQAGGSTGYQLIVEKMRAGDYTGAADLCDAFLKSNPESSRRDNVLLNLARCRTRLNQTDAAVAAYRQYLELKPSDSKSASEYSELLSKAGRTDEALTVAEQFLAHVEDESQRVYLVYAQGKALEGAGRYMEAKEKFRWVAANATGEYKFWSQEEMQRQDQLEEIRQRQRQNAGR